MATALAAQLAQLAAAKPAQERYVRGKPSLLFDYQKAADVSVEQLLNIARTGEARLCLRCVLRVIEGDLSGCLLHCCGGAGLAFEQPADLLQLLLPLFSSVWLLPHAADSGTAFKASQAPN